MAKTQTQQNQPAQPKTWNPGALLQLLSDLETGAPKIYAAAAPIIADLVNLFAGKAQAQAATCAPGCDCCTAIDSAIQAQVQALSAMLLAKCADDCPAAG